GFGDDTLFGGEGDDLLYGEQGEDVFSGGPGADSLFGGPDFDTDLDCDPNDPIRQSIESGCGGPGGSGDDDDDGDGAFAAAGGLPFCNFFPEMIGFFLPSGEIDVFTTFTTANPNGFFAARI